MITVHGLVVLVLVHGVGQPLGAPAAAAVGHAAAPGAPGAGTRAVVDWNRTALATAAVSNGLHEGHNLALAQAAVFDAANSITRRYHWRASDRVGQAVGRRIARYGLRHALQPVVARSWR